MFIGTGLVLGHQRFSKSIFGELYKFIHLCQVLYPRRPIPYIGQQKIKFTDLKYLLYILFIMN